MTMRRSIPLLLISPSSTAVDRVALYLIPLQLFVWSRVPISLGREASSKRQWFFIVLIYTFITHLLHNTL